MAKGFAPLTGISGVGNVISGMMAPLTKGQVLPAGKSGFAPLGQNPISSIGRTIKSEFGTPLSTHNLGTPFTLDTAPKFSDMVGIGAFGRLGSSAVRAGASALSTGLDGTTAQNGINGGVLTNAGGAWSLLDQSNSEIGNAASKLGVPPNLLKAMINNESSGDWNRDGSRVVYLPQRGDYILPFVGITKAAADSWGLNWNAMIGNKQAQVDGMATILNGLYRQYGSWDSVIKVYFGGDQALKGNWNDENGLGSNYYYDKTMKNWNFLDSQGGGQLNSQHGSQIVDLAKQYLGVPYVWGSLPGASQDPWQTGWDCSAFVNYLDDKYGSNQLPAGSHYQYQQAVDSGQLFTDMNQLQAGDIVYFDTGWGGGAGANMNRAGHVGMYIGNGQVINALNPSAGTVISGLNDIGTVLGGQHMSWSSGVAGGGIGTTGTPSSTLMQIFRGF